jgi:hypothetical protein
MPNGGYNRVREPSFEMGSFKETSGETTEGRMEFVSEGSTRMDFH